MKQYGRLLGMDGVNLTFTEGALRGVARAADEEQDRGTRAPGGSRAGDA